MSEKTIDMAMQILLHSGTARVHCKNALEAICVNDLTEARTQLDKANEFVTLAHSMQTETIQDEVSGNKVEYSLLLTHAQDTMMTIDSEINIAKHIIKIYESLNRRIEKLEVGK